MVTHGQVPSPTGLHLESPPGPHRCPFVSEVLHCGGPARPQSSSHQTGFRSISWSCFFSGRLRPSTILSITQICHKPLSKVPLPVAGDPQVDGVRGWDQASRAGDEGVKCLMGGQPSPSFTCMSPGPSLPEEGLLVLAPIPSPPQGSRAFTVLYQASGKTSFT